MPSKIFVLFPSPAPNPLARPTTFTSEIAPGTPYYEVVSAIQAMQPGESILLPGNTTYDAMSPLSIPEGASVYGAADGSTVIQSMGFGSDPTAIITVSAPNVRLQDLTVKQRRGANDSTEVAVRVTGAGSPATKVEGFRMINCKLESMEACLGIRASNYWIEGCEFRYVGPAANNHRLIDMRGSGGNGLIRNNTFYASNDATPRTREFIYLTSSTADDSYTGCLSMVGNQQMGGNLLRFFMQDYFSGTPGGFELVFENNSFTDLNGGFVAYGVTANYADLYSHITLKGNSAANAGKGLFGFDVPGAVAAARTTALPFHIAGNVLASGTVRADWTSIHGDGLVARSNLLSDALIAVDAEPRPALLPAN